MGYFSLLAADGSTVDFDAYGVKVVGVQGIGVPQPVTVTSKYALQDGQLFQRQLFPERVVTLNYTIRGSSLAGLHALRKALVGKVNRDVVSATSPGDQAPLWLRYNGSGTTYQVPVYYSGGLEQTDVRIRQDFGAIRFTSYDPFWRALTPSSVVLNYSQSLAHVSDLVWRRNDGLWTMPGGGVNGEVFAVLVLQVSGDVIVGGLFTTAYNGPGQTNPVTVNNIAHWSVAGQQWVALGATPGTDGVVKALAVDPNGNVIVGGLFAHAGGQAFNNVAQCNGPSDWNPIAGFGTNGEVRSLVRGVDGALYVGGLFTQVYDNYQAPVAIPYLGRYDILAGTWSALGSGFDASVLCACRGYDGKIYLGGQFNEHVKVWDGTTLSSMGTGVDADVYALAAGVDGSIYVGGAFRTANGEKALRAARWNGSTLIPLGGGVGPDSNDGFSIIRSLSVAKDGTVWAGGTFLTAEGVTLPDSVARWTGSLWVPADIDLPGNAIVRAVATTPWGGVLLGFNTTGTASTAALTTVHNAGNARAYPVLTISCSGSNKSAFVRGFANMTTGKEVYLNYNLIDGETLTIDLTPGARAVTSNFRGNVLSVVLPGGDFATWCLVPGDNPVSLFVVPSNAPVVTATLAWVDRQWSGD